MKIYKSFEFAMQYLKIDFAKEMMVNEILKDKNYKHRFVCDYAIKKEGKVVAVVEIEGGTWTDGRHTRGKGFYNDCLKYNDLINFIKLFRFTSQMVENSPMLFAEYIKKSIDNEMTVKYLSEFTRKLKKR